MTAEGHSRDVLVEGRELRAVRHRFPAGASIPEHVHRRSEELFVVVSGTARMHIAGTEHDCSPGDVLFARGGEPHAIEVGDEPLVLLVVVAPNVHDSDPTALPARAELRGLSGRTARDVA